MEANCVKLVRLYLKTGSSFSPETQPTIDLILFYLNMFHKLGLLLSSLRLQEALLAKVSGGFASGEISFALMFVLDKQNM
ncbi:hypothetical protein E2320_013056, partial [Naja naja]